MPQVQACLRLLITLLLPLHLTAQSSGNALEWITDGEYGVTVLAPTENDILWIGSGRASNPAYSLTKLYIAHLDTQGQMLHQWEIDHQEAEYFSNQTLVATDSFLYWLSLTNVADTNAVYYLQKIDFRTGVFSQTRIYELLQVDYFRNGHLKMDSSGNLLIGLHMFRTGFWGPQDGYYLAKLDQDLTLLQEGAFWGYFTSLGYDYGSGELVRLDATRDGGFITVGRRPWRDVAGSFNPVIYKFDSLFGFEWGFSFNPYLFQGTSPARYYRNFHFVLETDTNFIVPMMDPSGKGHLLNLGKSGFAQNIYPHPLPNNFQYFYNPYTPLLGNQGEVMLMPNSVTMAQQKARFLAPGTWQLTPGNYVASCRLNAQKGLLSIGTPPTALGNFQPNLYLVFMDLDDSLHCALDTRDTAAPLLAEPLPPLTRQTNFPGFQSLQTVVTNNHQMSIQPYQSHFENACGCLPPSGQILVNDSFYPVIQFSFLGLNTGNVSYGWDFGNGSSSTLADPLHNFGQDGFYPVCLTLTDDCGTVSICDTIQIGTVGQDLQEIADRVLLWPNPATDKVRLSGFPGWISALEVQITDVQGKVLQSFEAPTGEVLELRVGDLPAGLLFITGRGGDFQFARKLVLQ